MAQLNMPSSMPSAAMNHILFHVLTNLQVHRSNRPLSTPPPLFVALQGPQGSGKTFLTTQLRTILSSAPHSLSVAVISIDDLYLPRSGLLEVAESHPHNGLLKGRGQPGTHDIPLAKQILRGLVGINEHEAPTVVVPIFEKSLFGGEGDRVENGVIVKGPIDVVILEGWCVGFYPVDQEVVHQLYDLPVKGIEDIFDLKEFKKDDILEVNSLLWDYTELWSFFEVFIQIKPPESSPYAFIYKWRLQQEHNMKALNGGQGMTDEQVKKFIDRYIPGYIFFSDGLKLGYVAKDKTRMVPNWKGQGLTVTIDENRELIAVDLF